MSTPDTRADWAWIRDTYWIVLTPDLPALQFDPDDQALSWLVDQTVWHITGYQNGSLWGVTAAVMYEAGGEMPTRGPSSRIGRRTLLGTITPSGRVQLTFVAARGSTVVGVGQMVPVGSTWGFEMQMSTERLGANVLHWATMVQTRPGEPSWEQLPGLPLSVPQILEGATYPIPPKAQDAG